MTETRLVGGRIKVNGRDIDRYADATAVITGSESKLIDVIESLLSNQE